MSKLTDEPQGTKSVRVNISVSADLRRRMIRFARDNSVNWSEIAAKAFESLISRNESIEEKVIPPDCIP